MNEHSTPCPDDIKTLLSKLVDGELTPDERARAEEHLTSCAPCRELLDLFRKNEALMSTALGSEAFGNAVIESVVRKIRQEGPPEADPVEDGPLDWLRSRPWIPLSAAAALLVGLGALVLTQSSQMGALRRGLEASQRSQTDVLKAMASNQEQNERIVRELRTELATAGVKSRNTLGFVDDRGLIVRGGFDVRDFAYFEVWRRGEKDVEYRRINTAKDEERLARPEYTDRSARVDQVYWYKFRAVRANGEAVESAPIQMRAPQADGLSAEQSVKVLAYDLAESMDVGKFLLERVVDGKPAAQMFMVRTGEAIGGPVELAGLGFVDFTTGLTLGRIEEGQQTLPLSYAEPVLDDQGRPVIQKLENGVAVPLTRQHEVPLSIRSNLRATLRTETGAEKPLYKSSWLRVKAR